MHGGYIVSEHYIKHSASLACKGRMAPLKNDLFYNGGVATSAVGGTGGTMMFTEVWWH